MPAMSASPRSWPPWLWPLGVHLLAVLYVLWRDVDATAYDDSYFYKRFGLHWLEHGVFAWNVEDGAVYGCTSQLFQGLTAFVLLWTRAYYVVAIKVVNALCLLAAGAWLMDAGRRSTARPLEGAWLAILAFDTPLVLTTVHTGMETAFVLMLLAAILHRASASARGRPGVKEAALTLVVYAARPDAALIVAVFFAGRACLLERTVPWAYVAFLATGLAGILAAFNAYYGSPLPLSFAMKTAALALYDAEFVALSRPNKLHHAAAASVFALPLLWIAIRGCRQDAASRARAATIAALIAASVLLFAYQFVFTTEIMGYRSRFYVPGFVPLIVAATLAWDRWRACSRREQLAVTFGWGFVVIVAYLAAVVPTASGAREASIPWPIYAGWCSALALFMSRGSVPFGHRHQIAITVALLAGLVGWKPPRLPRVMNDDAFMVRHSREVTVFRGLFDVRRCLPNARVVYHSEMGVPGLVLAHARLVDLAGILSRETGVDSTPIGDLCRRDRPEAIFLPHKVYRRRNQELRDSGCLRDYIRVVERSSSPLYIRRDLHEPFLGCAREVQRFAPPQRRPRSITSQSVD